MTHKEINKKEMIKKFLPALKLLIKLFNIYKGIKINSTDTYTYRQYLHRHHVVRHICLTGDSDRHLHVSISDKSHPKYFPSQKKYSLFDFHIMAKLNNVKCFIIKYISVSYVFSINLEK